LIENFQITLKVERDINRVKKIQSDMLANAIVDQRAKQELDDAMTEIKKRANHVRYISKSLQLILFQLKNMH